jgi:hypothetical protein
MTNTDPDRTEAYLVLSSTGEIYTAMLDREEARARASRVGGLVANLPVIYDFHGRPRGLSSLDEPFRTRP